MTVQKLVEKGIKEYMKGNFRGSLEFYNKALKTKNPEQVDGIIWYNIGLAHYSLYDYEVAKRCFIKSFKLGHLKSGWEIALSSLHLEDIQGMEYFSYRYFEDPTKFPKLPIKKLETVEDIQSATNILVLNEQGFGDEILFSRGIKLLEGKNFSYQVYPEIIDLFQKNLKGNFFHGRTISLEFVNKHDGWIPAGDLFKLWTLQGNFDFPKFESKEGEKSKVGICFKTNRLSQNSDLRSVDPNKLKKILSKFNLNLISLQKDHKVDFAENREINNFTDSSEIIDECEFIITVDTVVAHLAAVKGKKVFLLWKEYVDWRWNFPFYGDAIELVHIDDLEDTLEEEGY